MIPSTDYALLLDQHRDRVRALLADVQQAQLTAAIRNGLARRRPRPDRGRPLRVRATITVHAPRAIVCAVYTDYPGWAATFSTITGVRLIERRNSTEVLELDHREGRVINELTVTGEGRIELRERKRHYDALFAIRADPTAAGTQLTVSGELIFKRAFRLLQPFLGPYVRRQLLRLQLDPVKRRAEAGVSRIDPPTGRSGAATMDPRAPAPATAAGQAAETPHGSPLRRAGRDA